MLRIPLLLLLTLIPQTIPMSELEDAVWHVESSRTMDPEFTGDHGKAIGPLQIWEICWTDVRKDGELYESCYELEYSLEIFRRYTSRYATASRLGRNPTDTDRARIWNGGPNGFKKDCTLHYAEKIQKILDED